MSDSGVVLQDISQRDANGLASQEGLTHNSPPIEDDSNLTSSINHGASLPPVDSGKDAWLFLAACFVVEALVWGKALTKRANA